MNKSQRIILISLILVSFLYAQRMDKWEAESRDVDAYGKAVIEAKELVKKEAELKFDQLIVDLENIKQPYRLNQPLKLSFKNFNGKFIKIDGFFLSTD